MGVLPPTGVARWQFLAGEKLADPNVEFEGSTCCHGALPAQSASSCDIVKLETLHIGKTPSWGWCVQHQPFYFSSLSAAERTRRGLSFWGTPPRGSRCIGYS